MRVGLRDLPDLVAALTAGDPGAGLACSPGPASPGAGRTDHVSSPLAASVPVQQFPAAQPDLSRVLWVEQGGPALECLPGMFLFSFDKEELHSWLLPSWVLGGAQRGLRWPCGLPEGAVVRGCR